MWSEITSILAAVFSALGNFFAKTVHDKRDRENNEELGAAKANIEAHELNAKRKEKADEVLAEPIKSRDELFAAWRRRSRRRHR